MFRLQWTASKKENQAIPSDLIIFAQTTDAMCDIEICRDMPIFVGLSNKKTR
jgi:hypothetical protein